MPSKSLSEKIQDAADRGKLYMPTREEWHNATRLQRQSMTWPREILAQIRD